MLWLATSIVHHANRVRENRCGVKVGGHQASSASMVCLMTALYFGVLEAPDRVSVKPHASPVLHAINHLLGRLDRRYLTTLREYGGLQSYPSRTKDPDPVDYSHRRPSASAPPRRSGARSRTATSPGHFDVPRGGRQIALIGDAELDEGACWEAIADPMVARLGEVMWVVDLNRQSLDRVVPDIAAGRLAAMFEAAGWHTVMVKYGPLLQQAPGPAGPHRRDAQRGVPAAPARRRARAARAHRGRRRRPRRRRAAGHVPRPRRPRPRRPDRRLPPGRRGPRPPVASSSPTRSRAGRCPPRATPPTTPRCSTTRSTASSRPSSARTPTTRSRRSSPARRRRELCDATGAPAQARRHPRRPRAEGPARPRPQAHRQGLDAAGLRALLRRPRPRGARRSPSASSRSRPTSARRTNLGGWINKAGHLEHRRPDRLVRRRHRHARALARARPRPPHRARDRRGQPRRRCSGELGATWSRDGQPLLPGRHDLRPVRRPRAGAVVVRHLRRRPVDPRRHALRRHARPRGRRAPVGDHAVASASSSPAASPTSPPSARTSSGASCTRSRSSASPAARAPTSGSRRARSTSRCTPARARRRSPAATSCRRARRARRS